ncbi:reverse transcriptase domain-containing protein [Tanacetum coccineum]
MDPIHEYLLSGLFPEYTKEDRKIRIQTPQYKLIRGNLNKRSFFTPWLRYLAPLQTDKIIKEIHEGSCGFNAEPRSLVSRITKQGFYWPSMHRKVSKVMQDCEKCKEQSAIRKAGTSGAIAAGKHTKIMHHIRRQLTRSQQGWVDNLAKTLWIHRTLLRNSEKEIPFSLTYGSEAVIPIIETIDDRGVQKATKEKENKEVASIEKAYYESKLRKYHNTGNSHPMYIVGDFVLLKRNTNEWQGTLYSK